MAQVHGLRRLGFRRLSLQALRQLHQLYELASQAVRVGTLGALGQLDAVARTAIIMRDADR